MTVELLIQEPGEFHDRAKTRLTELTAVALSALSTGSNGD